MSRSLWWVSLSANKLNILLNLQQVCFNLYLLQLMFGKTFPLISLLDYHHLLVIPSSWLSWIIFRKLLISVCFLHTTDFLAALFLTEILYFLVGFGKSYFVCKVLSYEWVPHTTPNPMAKLRSSITSSSSTYKLLCFISQNNGENSSIWHNGATTPYYILPLVLPHSKQCTVDRLQQFQVTFLKPLSWLQLILIWGLVRRVWPSFIIIWSKPNFEWKLKLTTIVEMWISSGRFDICQALVV